MIDLHCHLLPGIDDGARDLDTSVAMARMAASDGILATACTPHILPGVYNNTGPGILEAVSRLEQALGEAGIPLRLTYGADVHVAPDLGSQLKEGHALSLHGSRYFLLEPPHHALPPRFEEYTFGLLAAGYVPIITHPERLSWIEHYFPVIKKLVTGGCLMQLTAGSLTGGFGRRPQYWAERMLDDGLCHILATDAHDLKHRPPILSQARDIAAQRLSPEEAANLVAKRPLAILQNVARENLPATPVQAAPPPPNSQWKKVFARVLGRE